MAQQQSPGAKSVPLDAFHQIHNYPDVVEALRHLDKACEVMRKEVGPILINLRGAIIKVAALSYLPYYSYMKLFTQTSREKFQEVVAHIAEYSIDKIDARAIAAFVAKTSLDPTAAREIMSHTTQIGALLEYFLSLEERKKDPWEPETRDYEEVTEKILSFSDDPDDPDTDALLIIENRRNEKPKRKTVSKPAASPFASPVPDSSALWKEAVQSGIPSTDEKAISKFIEDRRQCLIQKAEIDERQEIAEKAFEKIVRKSRGWRKFRCDRMKEHGVDGFAVLFHLPDGTIVIPPAKGQVEKHLNQYASNL